MNLKDTNTCKNVYNNRPMRVKNCQIQNICDQSMK